MLSTSTLAAFLAAISLVAAHPHPALGTPEFVKRAEFQNVARRSLGDCQNILRKRGGLYERAVKRREAQAENLRRSLGVGATGPFKRDLESVLNTNHKSNLTGVTNNTDVATLFDGNSSCVLGPEVTQGPYYVDYEYVRWDVREEQEGVDLYVDIQLIDVNTCEPVPNVFIDFWHANATGVYSGVNANGNGNSSDETNLNSTFLRGIQETDEEGVAQWLTVFPGHYTGRTTHIHLLAAENGTTFDNGTYKSSEVLHVGQIFIDQELITAVEEVEPYNSNSQDLTMNEEDSIMAEEADEIDPVMQYVFLGDSIEDGIFGFISFGIDTSASYTVSAAATWTENGGLENSNSGGPGGGSPPGASGSAGGPAPSGSAFPSGGPVPSSV